MRKYFSEAATKTSFSDLCSADLIKTIFQRSLNKRLTGTFRGFSPQLYKWLHHLTEIAVARALQGYVPFRK